MDEDTRTLKIEIPGSLVTSSTGVGWDGASNANGWTVLPGLTSLFWEGTIDLSGYTREMKTFFPQAAFTQEGTFSNVTAVLPIIAAGIMQITVVSSIPLDPIILGTQFATGGGPGFLDGSLTPPTGPGQQDWNTVLFAETQVNVVNSTLPGGILQTLRKNQSGSLGATASDTLYVMKIIVSIFSDTGTIGSSLIVPASRVVIPGKFGTEPDVEYMMRLKRSVELANQV